MIHFPKDAFRPVDESTMRRVYEKIRTPHKYGVVLSFPGELCDCPAVFRYDGRWYMAFIRISKDTASSGYDSHLAVSDDLIHWEYLYKTLGRDNLNNWDSRQIALYAAYIENDLDGEYRIQKVNGKYYFSCMGGNLDGYETDPLMMGQVRADDPRIPQTYEKLPLPRLTPMDKDARKGETLTIYKSNLFIDESRTTGYRYVNAYNAKASDHKESIFLAVSENGEDWMRLGDRPVIWDDTEDKRIQINGDAQIFKWGDIYVMLYFVLENGVTYDTFACSYDLVNWTKWTGERLIESSEPYDEVYAHKPCLIIKDGIVYHFYCAVSGAGERTIALATSKKIGS